MMARAAARHSIGRDISQSAERFGDRGPRRDDDLDELGRRRGTRLLRRSHHRRQLGEPNRMSTRPLDGEAGCPTGRSRSSKGRCVRGRQCKRADSVLGAASTSACVTVRDRCGPKLVRVSKHRGGGDLGRPCDVEQQRTSRALLCSLRLCGPYVYPLSSRRLSVSAEEK